MILTSAKDKSRSIAWLIAANIGYALIIAMVSLCNAIGPERWWFIDFFTYCPQALWLIPGVVLLVLTLATCRKYFWIPLAVMLWIAGPLMGLVVRPTPDTRRAPDVVIRVMTYNVKWGREDSTAIAADIVKYNPDLICMQDSAGVVNTTVGTALKDWDVQSDGQYTIASKLPISALEPIDISFPGSRHHADRFQLLVNGAEVTAYTVHLLSPRDGLVNVRHHHLKPMIANILARLTECANLLQHYRQDQAGTPAPALLMGDLNSTPPSLVIREMNEAGLRDAFSEAGAGYGYSYGGLTPVRTPYIRIDHIMVNKYFRVTKCWVGNSIGSDHSPVIADIVKAQ